MRPRWHKVLADLFSHKIRSLLVIASIAVGLFAIGMITTVHFILSEDIRSGYAAVNPANIQVRAVQFDSDFVKRISHLPEVAVAQGAWNTNLQVRTTSGEWKPISIKALTPDDMQEHSINRLILSQGDWPPADRQIVLEVNKLADTGRVWAMNWKSSCHLGLPGECAWPGWCKTSPSSFRARPISPV